MRIRGYLYALALLICLIYHTTQPASSATAKGTAETSASWLSLSHQDQEPTGFVAFLRSNPSDQAHLDAALVWYSRRQPNFTKLHFYTFRDIEYHPDDDNIDFENRSPYFAHPEYLNEVIQRLKAHQKAEQTNASYFWLLATCCQQASIPPLLNSSWGRPRFLHYFDLSASTQLRARIDYKVAYEAVAYYRAAISDGGTGWLAAGQLPEDLADLLNELGKPVEAAAVCQKALPTIAPEDKADFLVTYGTSLYAAHRDKDAAIILDEVRGCETEGWNGGPAHATMHAEMLLDTISLDEGNLKNADEHLLASCNVQKCCHLVTQGFPLKLATRLLAYGQRGSVIEFCNAVLTNFTPNQPETEALLRRTEAVGPSGAATLVSKKL
jgi:hypothetical protein